MHNDAGGLLKELVKYCVKPPSDIQSRYKLIIDFSRRAHVTDVDGDEDLSLVFSIGTRRADGSVREL